jgi:hypothetical protein
MAASLVVPQSREGLQQPRHELRVWDIATGATVYTSEVQGYPAIVRRILAPDGSRLAVVNLHTTPRVTGYLSVQQLSDSKELFRFPPECDAPWKRRSSGCRAMSPEYKRV